MQIIFARRAIRKFRYLKFGFNKLGFNKLDYDKLDYDKLDYDKAPTSSGKFEYSMFGAV